jgi:murein DD-endopeptidase MepM/ murein hydrolase activator NlpD
MNFHALPLAFLMGSVPSVALVAQAPKAAPVKLLSSKVAPGGLLVVVAEGSDLKEHPLWARLGERRHAFFPHPANPARQAAVLVPVPFGTAPGASELVIETANGTVEQRMTFTVLRGSYPTLPVTIPKRIAEPSAEDRARAAREREEILKIQADPSPTRLWMEAFRDPVPGIVTCGFGATRKFNGVVQSVHKGLDLRAATGTPVHAPAGGTVRLAKELFFGGNLVYVDHGCGLFSAFAHLSHIDVAVGQVVKPGQLLGRSGATGRVNAPHLHWGSSIDGVDVDPRELKRWTAVLVGGAPTGPSKKPSGSRR